MAMSARGVPKKVCPIGERGDRTNPATNSQRGGPLRRPQVCSNQRAPRRERGEPCARVVLAELLLRAEQRLQAPSHGRIAMERTVHPAEAAQQGVIDSP